jgi:N-hydroxyarylamine O-acetyltransferase
VTFDHARLQRYRARIGDEGPLRADEATLRRLHRRHVLSVPFENLDVVRGRPVSLDLDAAFDKIVERGRGGWCFELNGLFGAALRAIGFRVADLGATVGAAEPAELNHLTLLVRLDQPWLADVGFGFGPPEPLRLCEGATHFTAGAFALARRDDVWLLESPGNGLGYAFTLRERGRDELEAANRRLQSDTASPFTHGLFVARALADGYESVHRTTYARRRGGAIVESRELPDAELGVLLQKRFGLSLDTSASGRG